MKPGVILAKPGATDTVDSAAHRLLQATTGTGPKISVKDIAVFLRLVLAQDRVQLKDDWVSFGTTIGRAGDFVSPLSLLNISDEPCNTDGIVQTNFHVEKQNVMLAILYVTGGFALAEEDPKHSSKINAKIEKYGGRWNSLTNFSRSVDCSAFRNPELKKLFAAMDMFYFKFPEAAYCESRVGTQRLRFEGCGGLEALKLALELLDVPMEMFASWCIVPSMVLELRSLMYGSHEEIDKSDSYLPYCMPLRLTTNSPYTINKSQNIYGLAHAVGCAFNEPSSANARRFPGTSGSSVAEGAIRILGEAARFKNEAAEAQGGKSATESKAQPPKSRSEILERWAAISNPRRGTVGELVKNYYESVKNILE
ncbi:hypothetical protein RP20_CCG000476 [Aedes albopictus]|nr:hypothetical protein RP20_CCG000476 [Aedes albopictus]